MEFGSSDHHHHHNEEEDEEEEEEEGSEEMLMTNNIINTNPNNHIITSCTSNSSLNRAKMVEALSQVQIHHPTSTLTTTTTTTTPPSSSSNRPRYRECLRNHAINVMGHALDGCGEFMPGGPDGSVEALKCAACGCHRNFHRKEEVGGEHSTTTALQLYSHHHHQQHTHPHTHTPGPFGTYYRASAGTTPSGYLHLGPPRPLALPSASGGGGGSQSRGEELDDVSDVPVALTGGHNGSGVMMMRNGGKKRFRTKFTSEQKERMLGMAERIGWRIQKCDEELVQQFCNETGVKRHVFKVWMHNNKHTLGKGITTITTPTTTTTTSSSLNIINNNNSSSSNTSSRQQQQLMN